MNGYHNSIGRSDSIQMDGSVQKPNLSSWSSLSDALTPHQTSISCQQTSEGGNKKKIIRRWTGAKNSVTDTFRGKTADHIKVERDLEWYKKEYEYLKNAPPRVEYIEKSNKSDIERVHYLEFELEKLRNMVSEKEVVEYENTETIEMLELEIIENKNQISNFKEVKLSQQETIEFLADELDSYKSRTEILESENHLHEEKIRHLESECFTYKTRIGCLEDDTRNYLDRIEVLEAELRRQKIRTETLESENISNIEMIAFLKKELETLINRPPEIEIKKEYVEIDKHKHLHAFVSELEKSLVKWKNITPEIVHINENKEVLNLEREELLSRLQDLQNGPLSADVITASDAVTVERSSGFFSEPEYNNFRYYPDSDYTSYQNTTGRPSQYSEQYSSLSHHRV